MKKLLKFIGGKQKATASRASEETREEKHVVFTRIAFVVEKPRTIVFHSFIRHPSHPTSSVSDIDKSKEKIQSHSKRHTQNTKSRGETTQEETKPCASPLVRQQKRKQEETTVLFRAAFQSISLFIYE
jgi:hypothetical protein